jgi:hypothetical protein
MKTRMIAGLVAMAGLASGAMAQVTISQVYGGGGNSGSMWQRDYVELRNNGTSAVSIAGWSLQYAGATAAFSTANTVVFPSGAMIGPGGYFLVALSQGTGGTTPLPTPDFDGVATGTGAILMSGTNGKVALVNTSTVLATCTDASIVDLVGYGTANCSETAATAALSNTSAAVRNTNGCTDTNNNSADFTIVGSNGFTPRNSQSPAFFCPGFPDCNNNGIPDSQDIGSGTSQDCNQDGVPDECQITGNDCNANGILDACEMAGNDCNNNGVLDACELATGQLTDVNNNGTPDACEGAVVVVANDNVTVQPAGIRPGGNGTSFMNVEGTSYAQFTSYGGLRWDVSAAVAAFNTQYGVGGWELTDAYLALTQSNAAFTFDGPVDLFVSNNDAQDFTVPGGTTPNANTVYGNFPTDFADALLIQQYNFVRGTGGPGGGGSGTREGYLLYQLGGSNNSAQAQVGAEINIGSGMLTLLLHSGVTPQFPAPDGDPFTAATYAGRTHSTYRGPSLVMWAQARTPQCDPDVNQDGNVDQDDVAYLINVVGGGPNDTGIDPDFNQDGNVDQDDVSALINVVAGGNCP